MRIIFISISKLVFLLFVFVIKANAQRNIQQKNSSSRFTEISESEFIQFYKPSKQSRIYCYKDVPYTVKYKGGSIFIRNLQSFYKNKIAKLSRSKLKNKKIPRLKRKIRLAGKACSDRNLVNESAIKSEVNNSQSPKNLDLIYSSFLDSQIGDKIDPECIDFFPQYLRTFPVIGKGNNVYIIAEFRDLKVLDRRCNTSNFFTRVFLFSNNGKTLVRKIDIKPTIQGSRIARTYDAKVDFVNNELILGGEYGLRSYSSDLKNLNWSFNPDRVGEKGVEAIRKISIAKNGSKLIATFGSSNFFRSVPEFSGKIMVFDIKSRRVNATARLDRTFSDVAISNNGDKFYLVGRKSILRNSIEEGGFKLNIGNTERFFDVPFVLTFNTNKFINNDNIPQETVWDFSASEVRALRNSNIDQSYLTNVEVGPSGDVYVLGRTRDGSNSVFKWNKNLRNPVKEIIASGDSGNFNVPNKSGDDDNIIFYARISSNGKSVKRGQFLVARSSNGEASSIKPNDFKIDSTGTILIIGETFSLIDNRLETINGESFSRYYKNQPGSFFLTINKEFTKRYIWSSLNLSHYSSSFSSADILNNKVVITGKFNNLFNSRRFPFTNDAKDRNGYDRFNDKGFFATVFRAK